MAAETPSRDPADSMVSLQPIESASVVGLAYEQIRTLILDGEMAPGARLGQVELAERLGISRTPVREALLRLTGEGLVSTISNRGFRVADLGLDAVMRRLEIRLLLEPGIARLAAARATPEDLAELRLAIRMEAEATEPQAAHDASRLFHVSLARATRNDDLVATLEAQWINEVGRRLLAQRVSAPKWQASDASEHEAIAAAVEAGDGERAHDLTRDHIEDALQHWNRVAERDGSSPQAA
jgi:DNA-binding GntR family transcriptional regulator